MKKYALAISDEPRFLYSVQPGYTGFNIGETKPDHKKDYKLFDSLEALEAFRTLWRGRSSCDLDHLKVVEIEDAYVPRGAE